MAQTNCHKPSFVIASILFLFASHNVAEEIISPPAFVSDERPTLLKKSSQAQIDRIDQPATTAILGLDEVILKALYADAQIRGAIESIRQAEADLQTAKLPPNPVISTSGTLMPLNRPFTVDRQGGPPQFDIGVSYPVDWFLFGKKAAEVAEAEKGIDVARFNVNDVIRQRIAGAIASFYDVLEAQQLLKLAEEDLKDIAELQKITTQRVAVGGVGTIELDRVKLSIITSRSEVRAREATLQGALSQLKSYLGTSKTSQVQIHGDLLITHLIPPADIQTLLAVAEENRPDIQAIRKQIERSSAALKVEEVNAYPSVTPRFGLTRQFQQKAIGYPDANSWGIGIDISLPLFDRNQGNIAKAKSVKTQSEYLLDSQLVELRSEIEQLHQNYANVHQVLSIDSEAKLESARSIRDKIKTAYALGGNSLFELLDAQRNYRDSYRSHIQNLSSYWHTLYALNAAVGKQILK